MVNTVTEKEKNLLPELVEIFQKLPVEGKKQLVWIGEGIRISSEANDQRRC